MNDHAVYFMLHLIDKVRGGLTRAAIQRASLLSEIYNDIGLITFDFDPDYDQVEKHYRKTGLWNDKIKHHNVYEFLSRQSEMEKNDEIVQAFSYGSSTHQRVCHDLEGRARKITRYDRKSGKPIKELLFAKNGRCFFERHVLAGKYILLDRNGNAVKTFKTVKSYRRYFVQTLIKDREAILLSDSRFTDKTLFGIRNDKAVKMAVLHSNHLQSPYQYGSTLVKRNELLFDRMNELDGFITLTESQARDIASRFGRRSTLHTVGHPAFERGKSVDEYDAHTAVMLVRYEGIKQIHHAIKAFKRVAKKVPEARLEIWGFGREEKRYRRLIKRLGLDNHVFIRGFTDDIEKTFRSAAFSLITSKSEAFGMSIIESMSVGTPVICYACKYGPADIITHEKNGLLIETGNIKSLAAAMIDLFLNKEKRNALSKEAMKITERFGEQKWKQTWRAVFDAAREQSRQRVHLEILKADINKIALDETGIEIEGMIQFEEIDQAFLQKIVLFLQLRRRKEMEDLYAPISIRLGERNTLLFKGKFTDLHKLHKGCWDVNLSVSCLNFHRFVQPALISGQMGGRNAGLKLCNKGQRVFVKVYRPRKKRPFNFYFFLEKYKAKVRDKVRSIGGYIK